MAPTVRALGNARLSMLAKPRTLSTRQEFVADIQRQWSNALEATVAIGRRLNEAKAALPHGEYEAMVASDLPFSSATARKLRECADLVDSGKVPLDRLPEAYSTIYAIATMPDEVRQEALDTGVIRPEMKRAELEAFKAARKPAEETETATPPAQPGRGLQHLFSGADPEPTFEPARPAPLPLITEQQPADEVELPEGVELPAPLIGVRPVTPLPSMAGAEDLPWFLNPKDTASVMVRLNGEDMIVVAAVTHEPAASALAEYIVNLHNARLMAGNPR